MLEALLIALTLSAAAAADVDVFPPAGQQFWRDFDGACARLGACL